MVIGNNIGSVPRVVCPSRVTPLRWVRCIFSVAQKLAIILGRSSRPFHLSFMALTYIVAVTLRVFCGMSFASLGHILALTDFTWARYGITNDVYYRVLVRWCIEVVLLLVLWELCFPPELCLISQPLAVLVQ